MAAFALHSRKCLLFGIVTGHFWLDSKICLFHRLLMRVHGGQWDTTRWRLHPLSFSWYNDQKYITSTQLFGAGLFGKCLCLCKNAGDTSYNLPSALSWRTMRSLLDILCETKYRYDMKNVCIFKPDYIIWQNIIFDAF